VILPRDNEATSRRCPPRLRAQLTFVPVERIGRCLQRALEPIAATRPETAAETRRPGPSARPAPSGLIGPRPSAAPGAAGRGSPGPAPAGSASGPVRRKAAAARFDPRGPDCRPAGSASPAHGRCSIREAASAGRAQHRQCARRSDAPALAASGCPPRSRCRPARARATIQSSARRSPGPRPKGEIRVGRDPASGPATKVTPSPLGARATRVDLLLHGQAWRPRRLAGTGPPLLATSRPRPPGSSVRSRRLELFTRAYHAGSYQRLRATPRARREPSCRCPRPRLGEVPVGQDLSPSDDAAARIRALCSPRPCGPPR